jgi:hypothetical protein
MLFTETDIACVSDTASSVTLSSTEGEGCHCVFNVHWDDPALRRAGDLSPGTAILMRDFGHGMCLLHLIDCNMLA